MTPTINELEDVRGAMRALKLSKQFLYRLPEGTPGVFRFGRSLRFDITALREWAAQQAAK
jgi:hypothetical protein